MLEKTETKPIFLENGNILYFEGKFPHAIYGYDLTRNIESLGLDMLDTTVGGYRIIANVSLHRASLAFEQSSLQVIRTEGVLYDGSIQIYGQRDFRAEEEITQGYGLLATERIWTAITDEQQKPQPTLGKVVLGETPTEDRVRAILRGYEILDKNTRKANAKQQHDCFLAGKRSR